MTSETDKKWREALPQTNYFDKAIELSASFDRLMVTLFSALIAGIVVLLLREEVSLWVGAQLVLAVTCFVLGIGHTLIHISFASKMLLLAEALENETEFVPNVVEYEEPTIGAFERNQAYAQRSYSSQILYLMIGIFFGALAIIARLWEYAWRAGVVVMSIAVVLFVLVALVITWKKTLRRWRPSIMTEQQQ